ncbi:sulfite exporter TauE/SafE family protein [Nisaea acidiphila]|uniref:Probable membrane transporter protein n=1 Tax=Nisaea acidiphila TaxID=1862145 RepID=A0A9J7AN78_9PROT|nr:sulfite exporter TauE/SafE family protein [Nisaea acidiphila]UUX48033.1 sulfite exporter TauE/SafE family protein [Nisaea acidiphila]
MNLTLAAGAVGLAGLVRGFSGFGAAMISIPLLSLLFGPQTALATLTTMEMPAQIQLLRMSRREADWKQAAPMALGGIAALPLGTWILVSIDQEVLRQAISVIVLALVALLASGYRHNVPRRLGVDVAVGSVAGFLNGSTGLGGPPIIFYLLSGPYAPAAVRANITAFFQIGFVFVVASYFWFGVLTPERMLLGALIAPCYVGGIWFGGKLFYKASERTFRRIAYILLAVIGGGTLFG